MWLMAGMEGGVFSFQCSVFSFQLAGAEGMGLGEGMRAEPESARADGDGP